MTLGTDVRGVAILGSTGSIGTTALRVLSRHEDRFRVAALTAYGNAALLRAQAERFRPSLVGLGRETALFVNARGGRLSRQAAWALVRQRGKNAGLGETVGPQLLRHTCAAHLLEDGVAPAEVRRILGQVGR